MRRFGNFTDQELSFLKRTLENWEGISSEADPLLDEVYDEMGERFNEKALDLDDYDERTFMPPDCF